MELASYQRVRKAEVLLEHRRYDQAREELGRHLASSPEDAHARTLLARCYAFQGKLKEALKEGKAAVTMEPDSAFSQIVLAEIFDRMGRYGEAERSAAIAVGIATQNPSYYGVLANIRLHAGKPRTALEAADAGLTVDAESAMCASLRALALTRLGRVAEAVHAADAAVRQDPLDATSHASRGWVELESGRPKQALEHFREALRLDPELKWAKSGMVTALKARYLAFRMILAWSFFLQRFPAGARTGIIAGLWAVSQLVNLVASSGSVFAPVGTVLFGLYMVFAYLTWTANPMFNTLLRFNPYGRLLLTRDQVISSTFFAATCLIALTGLVMALVTSANGWWTLAIGAMLVSVFIDVVFTSRNNFVRRITYLTYTISMGVVLFAAYSVGLRW